MKHTEICMVNKEKLFNLINKVIGLYEIVDDHWILVECSLNNGERARKTDMRALNNALSEVVGEQFEYIGCDHDAVQEFDEDKMFENILDNLEPIPLEADTVPETGEQNDLSGFLEQLGGIFLSGNPVTISASICINTGSED